MCLPTVTQRCRLSVAWVEIELIWMMERRRGMVAHMVQPICARPVKRYGNSSSFWMAVTGSSFSEIIWPCDFYNFWGHLLSQCADEATRDLSGTSKHGETAAIHFCLCKRLSDKTWPCDALEWQFPAGEEAASLGEDRRKIQEKKRNGSPWDMRLRNWTRWSPEIYLVFSWGYNTL